MDHNGCKPEFLKEFWVVGINCASVEDGRDLIELLPWSKTTVLAEARLRSDEVHAPTIVLLAEVILEGIFIMI